MLSVSTTGCYLSHLADGQLRLLRARRPVAEVVADPATPDALRRQLETIQAARHFALGMGLTVEGQYTSYVEWPGDRMVTTVVGARPGEVTPAGFWFPIVGTVPYKGFFEVELAEAEALDLRRKGLDVCVVPVSAYSTLGWIDDPITSPMLQRGEGETVETIFHELVHATTYVSDHAEFNETVASFIGQEASIRFYEAVPDPEAARSRRRAVEDERALNAALVEIRRQVEHLYANSLPGRDRSHARLGIEARARTAIKALPLHTGDAAELALRLPLNDACLALSGTYAADLDRYVRRLAELADDLSAFISALRAAGEADDPARALLGP